jgi:hypothetical protein
MKDANGALVVMLKLRRCIDCGLVVL